MWGWQLVLLRTWIHFYDLDSILENWHSIHFYPFLLPEIQINLTFYYRIWIHLPARKSGYGPIFWREPKLLVLEMFYFAVQKSWTVFHVVQETIVGNRSHIYGCIRWNTIRDNIISASRFQHLQINMLHLNLDIQITYWLQQMWSSKKEWWSFYGPTGHCKCKGIAVQSHNIYIKQMRYSNIISRSRWPFRYNILIRLLIWALWHEFCEMICLICLAWYATFWL